MPTYCIIGANRGLGLEFVRQLAGSLTADDTIVATTREGADRTDLAALASAAALHTLDCDTSSVRSIHLFAQKVRRNVLAEDQKVDYLLVVAGIDNSPAGDASSLALDPSLLAEQVTVNVMGPAKVLEFFSDNKILAPNVRVLNMSSSLGSIAIATGHAPRVKASYSVSKAALNMLTVHQAYDLRQKADTPAAVVIAMDPGWVRTRMGGDQAPLDAETSIAGMLSVLHGLKDEDNAGFFEYSGKKQPW